MTNNEIPQINFTTLVLGFSTSALSYLGYQTFDGQELPQKNFDLAKQNIDIIALLEEKTKGNLSKDESDLISQVLSDLRLKYVDSSKNKNS